MHWCDDVRRNPACWAQLRTAQRVIDWRGGDTNAIDATRWWECLQEVKPIIFLPHLVWHPHQGGSRREWRGSKGKSEQETAGWVALSSPLTERQTLFTLEDTRWSGLLRMQCVHLLYQWGERLSLCRCRWAGAWKDWNYRSIHLSVCDI